MVNLTEHMQATVDRIAGQQELDAYAVPVQDALDRAFTSGGELGEQIEAVLHGAPLGHALHPALVTVPIGAWTVTQVLDIAETTTGSQALATGADAALLVGLAGALFAAAAGLTDWKAMDGGQRRVGLVHGLLNTGAAALYASSLSARMAHKRPLGRTLATLGYTTTMLSSYLGGELVYRFGAAVERVEEPVAQHPMSITDRLKQTTEDLERAIGEG
jgi:uncharacterized membrane protein